MRRIAIALVLVGCGEGEGTAVDEPTPCRQIIECAWSADGASMPSRGDFQILRTETGDLYFPEPCADQFVEPVMSAHPNVSVDMVCGDCAAAWLESQGYTAMTILRDDGYWPGDLPGPNFDRAAAEVSCDALGIAGEEFWPL